MKVGGLGGIGKGNRGESKAWGTEEIEHIIHMYKIFFLQLIINKC